MLTFLDGRFPLSLSVRPLSLNLSIFLSLLAFLLFQAHLVFHVGRKQVISLC